MTFVKYICKYLPFALMMSIDMSIQNDKGTVVKLCSKKQQQPKDYAPVVKSETGNRRSTLRLFS